MHIIYTIFVLIRYCNAFTYWYCSVTEMCALDIIMNSDSTCDDILCLVKCANTVN